MRRGNLVLSSRIRPTPPTRSTLVPKMWNADLGPMRLEWLKWRVQASRASRREFNSRGVRWFRRPFRITRDTAGNGLETTTN
jgi:hypothetical protein